MSKKITAMFLAGAFAAMPTLCFAADQVVDNGPLPAGEPASVHEAQVEGLAPATIALVTAAVIVAVVVTVGNTSPGPKTF